jgi:hypothetical protein
LAHPDIGAALARNFLNCEVPSLLLELGSDNHAWYRPFSMNMTTGLPLAAASAVFLVAGSPALAATEPDQSDRFQGCGPSESDPVAIWYVF